jgi:uncharacterized protein YgbK (DUF1537 family)
MSDLLLSFFADDFTGSTDAMESLARAGLRTVLFTAPPTPAQLAGYSGLRAFGVAGMTRAMPPDEMEDALTPALTQMRRCGAPIVHYKVCSTFDSSPTVGSIGRAIDVGARIFDSHPVPVVAAAPALGRYCVFGNLFARCGPESAPHRLDRHPSMGHHPITPMDEADLRLHLAKQTSKSIGLINVLELQQSEIDLHVSKDEIVLIDLLYESQLAKVGEILSRFASARGPVFLAGSSGVESALAAHWKTQRRAFPPVAPAKPILAVCGSRSPVTAAQIHSAQGAGFAAISIDEPDAGRKAIAVLRSGCSTIIHAPQFIESRCIGEMLGRLVRVVLDSTPVRRMIVAGGDTSGQVARALGIEALEMIAELTRGSPLCRASAPGSPADGMEITFKGGQIGPADFFRQVEQGVFDV